MPTLNELRKLQGIEIPENKIDSTKLTGKLIKGILAPASIDKETKEKIGAVGAAQIQKTAKTIKETPLSLLGLAEEGRIDSIFNNIGEALANSSSQNPMYGVNIYNMQAPKRKLEISKDHTPIKDKTKEYLAKHPYVNVLVKEKRKGLESPVLQDYQWKWTKLNEEQEQLLQKWSSADPFEGGINNFVANAGKLVLTQGEVLVHAATFNGLALHDLMYEEQMQSAQAAFMERGIPFRPQDYKDMAEVSAIVQGAAEFIGNKVSLNALLGKATLGKLLGKKGASQVLAGIKTGASQIFGAGVEGTTEATQSLFQDYTTNKMLAKYAEENNVNLNLITEEQMAQNAQKAFEMGVVVGGVFQAGGTVTQFEQFYEPQELQKQLNKKIEEFTEDELGKIVFSYRQTAQRYGEEALSMADSKLRKLLNKEELGDLYNIANAYGIQVKTGTKEEVIDSLMDNRGALPAYRKLGLDAVMEQIEKSERSNLQKHFYKWMAQGDINPKDIIQIRSIMESAIKNSNYEGSLEDYFEQYMQLAGPKGYIEFNQIFNPDDFYIQGLKEDADYLGLEFQGFNIIQDTAFFDLKAPETGSNFDIDEGETIVDAYIRHLNSWDLSKQLSPKEQQALTEKKNYLDKIKRGYEGDLQSEKSEFVPLNFMQKGRKLPSGSQVIRGQVSVLQEGKFILDLFKTGDIVTLAHEFAHLISPQLNEDMRDTLVESVLETYHDKILKNKGLLIQKRDQYKRIWDVYSSDPFRSYERLGSQDKKLLVQMQEHLAEQFEKYLTTSTAPNQKFKNSFKAMRNTMLKYYKQLRKTPFKFQDVDPELAYQFDQLIAGDEALPQDVQMEVMFRDEEGKEKFYTVNKSRPQIKRHKLLLKSLEQGVANYSGLHEKLLSYTEDLLGTITNENRKTISLVNNRTSGIKYLESVDIQLAKIQQNALAKKQKQLRKLIKGFKKQSKLDIVKNVFDDMLLSLDPNKQTEVKIRDAFRLKKAFAALTQELDTIPEELRNVTQKELDNFNQINLRSIESLSEQELDVLLESVKTLIKYNKTQLIQNQQNLDAQRERLNLKGRMENSANWRYKKNLNRNRKLVEDKLIMKFGNAYAAEMKRQLVTFEVLAGGNPDSFWNIIKNDLIEGRNQQLELQHKYDDFLRELKSVLPDHGISKTLGRVKSSDYIEIQLKRTGDDTIIKEPNEDGILEYKRKDTELVKVTMGELMMLYGYTQNAKSKRHLLKGGIRFLDQKEELYTFLSEESLFTALSHLPDKYKQVVDDVIDYYDAVIYPELNEVFKDMNLGVSLDKEDRYLPLFVEWENRGSAEFLNMDKIGQRTVDWYRQHIESLGFLNIRTGAQNPIYAVDFFDGVASNMRNVAFYIGMAKPITEARVQIFGKKGMQADGKPSIHFQLTKMEGKENAKAMEEWLNRLESPFPPPEPGILKHLVKMNAKARKGILNLSASISAIQTVSSIGVMNYDVSSKEFLQAVGSNIFTRQGLSIKDLMELHPLLRERYERIPAVAMEAEGVDHRARRSWVAPTSFVNKILNIKSKQDLMDVLSHGEDSTILTLMYMDSKALSIIYKALEIHGQKLNWDKKTLLNKFMEVVVNTQPMNDSLYVSNFMSTKNALYKMTFGVFQSARDSIRGEIQRNYGIIQNKLNGQTEGSVWTNINNITRLTLINAGIIASIQELFYQIGRDEDEDKVIWFWLARVITNMFSLAPIIGDLGSTAVNSNLRGWEASVGEMPLISVASDLVKLETSKGIPYAILETSADIATINGNAWGNIERQAEKIYKQINKKSNEL